MSLSYKIGAYLFQRWERERENSKLENVLLQGMREREKETQRDKDKDSDTQTDRQTERDRERERD